MVRDQLGFYVGRTTQTLLRRQILEVCWVRTNKDTILEKNLFVYFYVCFDALKRVCLEGVGKLFGIDGWLLKGLCKRELLVAVVGVGIMKYFPWHRLLFIKRLNILGLG